MQWKSIKGYEGYYEVSDLGDVRSLKRIVIDKNNVKHIVNGKIMSKTESKNKSRCSCGYFVVNLRKNGCSKVMFIHRLVAEAFLENPNNMPTVNHIDGNKQNNNVCNLEWSSYSENNKHAIDSKLRSSRGRAVVQLNCNGEIIEYFKSVSEASRETGISRGMISHCIHGRSNKAGGYYWKIVGECNDYLGYESTTDDELPLEAQERINSKI